MAKGFGFPLLAVIPRMEDPQQTVLQVRRDRKLYLAASAYFTLILAVLGAEVAGITVISSVMSKLIIRLTS
jgi:hypothetical protein